MDGAREREDGASQMRPEEGCECGCPLGGMNSKQFVRSHMATMCVADFLTTEVWTLHGLVRYHTLFVMNLAKRKVQIAQISCQMNGQVMAQVARNLTDAEDGFLTGMKYFVCETTPCSQMNSARHWKLQG